jgi:hypothetical protein
MSRASLWSDITQPAVKENSPTTKNTLKVKDKEPAVVKHKPGNLTPKEKMYYVLAGRNKNDRQLYLSGYKDCMDWAISIVPFYSDKDKMTRLINKATNQLEQKFKSASFRGPKIVPNFELKEVNNE